MLLLTNKQVNINNNKQLWQIIEIYLTRWNVMSVTDISNSLTTWKTLESLGYNSIRNMFVMVHAIAICKHIPWNIHKIENHGTENFYPVEKIFWVPSFYNMPWLMASLNY